jgi:hypothetical protein
MRLLIFDPFNKMYHFIWFDLVVVAVMLMMMKKAMVRMLIIN